MHKIIIFLDRMKRNLILICFISISYFLSANQPISLEESIKRSDIVFTGELIDYNQKTDEFVFQISNIFKGEYNQKTIRIHSLEYMQYLNKDRSLWVVFAYKINDSNFTFVEMGWSCSIENNYVHRLKLSTEIKLSKLDSLKIDCDSLGYEIFVLKRNMLVLERLRSLKMSITQNVPINVNYEPTSKIYLILVIVLLILNMVLVIFIISLKKKKQKFKEN